jgi:hypothetical protein
MASPSETENRTGGIAMTRVQYASDCRSFKGLVEEDGGLLRALARESVRGVPASEMGRVFAGEDGRADDGDARRA